MIKFCTFFSNIHGIVTKIGHVWAIKQVPIHVKKLKLWRAYVYFDHNGIEIKKISRKMLNIRKLKIHF